MSSVRHDVHDEAWLRQRTAAGLDQFDEVWDGVLHVVPPPSGDHQWVEASLIHAFFDRAVERGCRVTPETGVFDPVKGLQDFRVPDLSVYRLENATARGIDGRAELVVEIRSPRDETYEKFGFYASHAVQQVLVVHPVTRAVELYDLDGDGYRRVEPGPDGIVTIGCLDADLVTVATDDGPRLQITVGDVTTSV